VKAHLRLQISNSQISDVCKVFFWRYVIPLFTVT
jgi:hypothetical protein